jgi:hypothetical protein
MEDGMVLTVDETEVMERAQRATDKMLERSGLGHLLNSPPTLWKVSHY